ncbi:ATP-binding cassette subfamily B protein [Bacillus oleivorans]|uniref:ATP-binding cassette subfamily B protein n=1 Tax=Bacillus oleivorans TaxID=1448271 RepID=A0A285CR28_9BACI|nr:ABC transporter transmembrane domain-containing protein [Bacillus oleivorans]SNX69981.1 ATP-binding cassette subfamily B protein [Bacillus oleivorans]
MFKVFKQLSWFFKEEWKRYTIALIFLAIVGVIDIMPARLVGMAIDDIHQGILTNELILIYILGLIGIAVASYSLTYVWVNKLFGGAFVVERKLRSKFMNHLLKMTPVFYEKYRTGDLMARGTNDLKAISTTAGFGILTLMDSSIFMITVLFAMGILISWKLTFAAIIPLPIMAYVIKILGEKIHKRFTVAQDRFGEMNNRVLESVSGVRVIRAYVQERADEARFNQMTEDVYEKNLAVAKIDSLFGPIIKVLVGISYLIGLGYGSYLVFQQTISLGDLVTFNVYLGMMIWPMFAVGELINVMQRGSASLDRLQNTLSYEPDITDVEKPISVSKPENVDFNRVSFQYPTSNVQNLDQVKVHFNRGETLGIVGKTGSGKTTFVKQLLKYYPKGEGELTISGIPIEQQTIEQVRDFVGYVPQDHTLFSKTVRENILFGKPEATEEELRKAIELAAFDQDIQFLPEGLETLVGEKGVALSGGQKQRISIARALIKDPEILILDDSLSAVDAKTESRIIENIRRERSGKTTIITTHRLSAVQHADWIIVLDDGKIAEEGTHEILMKIKDGWYHEQYLHQQLESAVGGGDNQ